MITASEHHTWYIVFGFDRKERKIGMSKLIHIVEEEVGITLNELQNNTNDINAVGQVRFVVILNLFLIIYC